MRRTRKERGIKKLRRKAQKVKEKSSENLEMASVRAKMCFELYKKNAVTEYEGTIRDFTRRLECLKGDAKFLAKFKDEARRGVAEIVERGKREVGISLEQIQEYKIPFPREVIEEWSDMRCPIEEVRAVLAIGHEQGENLRVSRFDVPQ